jgi:hypothetical protein
MISASIFQYTDVVMVLSTRMALSACCGEATTDIVDIQGTKLTKVREFLFGGIPSHTTNAIYKAASGDIYAIQLFSHGWVTVQNPNQDGDSVGINLGSESSWQTVAVNQEKGLVLFGGSLTIHHHGSINGCIIWLLDAPVG